MVYDFQRASLTKRIPAWILDFILLITLVSGFMWAWSQVIDIAPDTEAMLSIEMQYKEKYDGQLKVSIEEYEKMTEEEIINHPDKIIGVVSCVPTYSEWGGAQSR